VSETLEVNLDTLKNKQQPQQQQQQQQQQYEWKSPVDPF